jgi:hypothetical protein
MPAQIFDYDVSLDTLLDENSRSLTQLEAYPMTASMAADFQAFQGEILAVIAQEILLRVDIHKASALVAVADDDLDMVVDAVSKTLLIETGGDTSAQLYLVFFGDKRACDFRRPVLGEQLAQMHGWISLLKTSTSAALNALADPVEAKVKAGDAAFIALTDAKLKNKEFRTVGDRKALIDKFNALRKLTYGKLSELPHKHPEKNLPGSFAERFFKHVVTKKPAPAKPEPTAAELEAMVAASEANTASLKERLAEAIAKEEAAAKAKGEVEAKKAALAEAQKAANDALAKVAALKASIPMNA